MSRMGSAGAAGSSLIRRWTKTVRIFIAVLHISVLTKMPRDCTAPNQNENPADVQSRPYCVASHTTVRVQDSSFENLHMQNDSRTRSARSDFLQSLVAKSAITQDGKDWLIAALDPFHDFAHPIAGYPDADAANTVVSCYQYQTEVKAPAGVAGNWDCHVFNTPLADTATYNVLLESADWSYVAPQVAPQSAIIGPLTIVSAATNGALLPLCPVPATTVSAALPPAPTSDIAGGVSRVIGMGFEVHNTTSALNKQGAVCTYRMPCNAGPNQTGYEIAGPSYADLTGVRYPAPPSSVAQAQRLRGSRTWNAEDGVYANCFQGSIHNPLAEISCKSILINDSQSGSGTALVSPVVTNLPVVTPQRTKTIPFDVTGAMFTGLSNSTTLTVKLRVYVERAPTIYDASLAPLASPSAGYDVNTLQLYAQAINMLPCAVKVNENAAGDWFKAVVSVLKHVAGPVGAVMNTFVPGAGLVGNAVQQIMGQLDNSKPIARQAVARATADAPRVAKKKIVKAPSQKKKLPKRK